MKMDHNLVFKDITYVGQATSITYKRGELSFKIFPLTNFNSLLNDRLRMQKKKKKKQLI